MDVSPRNRIVVFRLSQEEYRNLRQACSSRGARSISDFTRSQILVSLSEDSPGNAGRPGFEKIAQEIIELRSAVAILADGLAVIKAADGKTDKA